MSRSRGQSSNSVSLFPFLAVLVCAMGSLIFLLIVTTRQIRSETVAKQQAKRQEEKIQSPVSPSFVQPVLPLAMRPKVVDPLPMAKAPELPQIAERIEPIPGLVELGMSQSSPVLPPVKVVPPPPPEPDPEPIWPAAIAQKPNPPDPNAALRARLAELEAARKAWLDRVQSKEQTVAKLQAQVDALTENLKRINSQIEAVAKERSANGDTQRQLLLAQNQMLGQLAKVEQQIADAQKLANASATKFQVVPFDGQTGTNYRPILIECTAAGMRFLPEDVLLTQSDFDSFTLGKNPLLAGAKALSDYWSKVSVRSGGKEPEPYVLLIVRPSGAKYFAARQLLEALDRPFGYELVEETLPINVPPVDPVAAELCRTAVEAVLKEREDLKKLLATHGPEILGRNPNYRVKRKPEGGFEVEYAPDGKFSDEGLGSTSGPREIGDPGPGPSRSNTNDMPQGHGVFGETRRPGEPDSTFVTQVPHLTGDNPGTDPTRKPFSNRPGTARTGEGGEFESPASNPGQPGLLPQDIIRRSQGHVPYQPGNGAFTPPAPSPAPDNRGSGDSNLAEGNSFDGSNASGSPEAKGQDLSQGTKRSQNGQEQSPSGTVPAMPGQNHVPDALGQDGQSTTPSVVTSPPPASNVTELGSPSKPQTLPTGPLVGTPGSAAGGLPQSDTPMSAYEAGMPNFYTLNERRLLNPADPYQRRWGLSDPRASIGFEREIVVRIEPARLVVGNAFAVAYDAGTTKEELGAGMLEAIERTARKWGRPPMSFYWVPTILFQASESEAGVYRVLNGTAKSWGLETSAEEIR